MRPSDSIEKYPSKVREYTNYAIKNIKNVCSQFGPRPVCSEADEKARGYMLKELESCCDTAVSEPLKTSDKAFMAWVPFGAVLLIASSILYFIGFAAVSLALTLIALFFIITEFIFYKKTLDIFFKKKDTANLYGVRKASGETKRRIILSGHTDSAFEWTYTYHGGRPAVLFIILSAIIGIVLSIAASVVSIVNNQIISFSLVTDGNLAMEIMGIAFLVLNVAFIPAIFFCNYKRPVIGANDDLTGSFISVAVVKFLDDNNIRFENTEVDVLLAAGEEAGLRGSKAFAQKHAEEFKNSDVETIFVGFDTIREMDFMTIYDKDMTGTVQNDPRVAALIKQGAKNAGFDVPVETIDLGATDAAAMSQAGIAAASFCAMDPTPARYYHTRLDTQDNLSPKMIEAGLNIALETAFLFDEKGIN